MSDGNKNHRPWGKMRGALILFCGVWLIGTLAMDTAIAWQWYHQAQTSSWLVTQGVIDQYEVTKKLEERASARSNGPVTRTRYHLKLAYTYEVDGQTYTSQRLRYAISSSYSSLGQVPKFEKGQAVRVYHHPDKPAASVLQNGVNDLDRAMVFFIIPFNVALAGMVLMFLSIKRRSRVQDPRPKVIRVGNKTHIRYADITPLVGGWIGLLFGSFAVAMIMLLWLGTGPMKFQMGLIAIPCLAMLAVILTWLALRSGAGSLILDHRMRTLAIPKRGLQAARTVPLGQLIRLEMDERPHLLGYEGIFTPVAIRELDNDQEPERLKLAQFAIRREALGFISTLEMVLKRVDRPGFSGLDHLLQDTDRADRPVLDTDGPVGRELL